MKTWWYYTIVFIAMVLTLFFVRLILPSQIDDVSPNIFCEEKLMNWADIYYVIPKYENVSINEEWCNEILAKKKKLELHGVYHIFEEFGVGTIIDAGTIDHSTWYNIKSTVKRIASNNEFELFINNTSQGTGTDNSFTESKFIVLSMGIGDKIAYADLSGGHNIIKGATS